MNQQDNHPEVANESDHMFRKLVKVLNADPWIYLYSLLAVAFWIPYLAKMLLEIDLMNSSGRASDAPSSTFLLSIAIIFSLIFLPISSIRLKNSWHILTHGVAVPYVINEGKIYKGMQDVTFEYVVNGKRYRKRKSLYLDSIANGFTLIVDPSNPKRVMIQDTEPDSNDHA